MPSIVIVFGIFIGLFGAISVMLTIFQPVLYNAFCTRCLADFPAEPSSLWMG